MESSCPTQTLATINSRVEFETHPPTVNGYPSTGGILRLPLDFAVAEYLGLPRLEATNRSENAAEEDAFCKRLQLLGAQWWESYDTYVRKLIGMDHMGPEERKKLVVGWPSNRTGVWILRLDEESSAPPDFAKLGLCIGMDERCSLLEEWGGTFVEDPSTVPEFKQVLEQGKISL